MNETTLPAAETARFARLQFLRSLKPLDVAVQDVHYLGGIATVDGVRASFRLDVSRYESAADYAGMTAPQAFAFADLSMTDRAAWDEAHPGVEPLPDAMLAALENAAEEVGELAQDALESDGEPAGGWED